MQLFKYVYTVAWREMESLTKIFQLRKYLKAITTAFFIRSFDYRLNLKQ